MFKNKKLTSAEFDKIFSYVITNQKDIEVIKNSIEILKTNGNSLRGLMNRRGYQEKEEDKEEDENLKYKAFI